MAKYKECKLSVRLMVNGRVEKFTADVAEGTPHTKSVAEILLESTTVSMSAKREAPGAVNAKGETTNEATEKARLTAEGIREVAEQLAKAAGITLPKVRK